MSTNHEAGYLSQEEWLERALEVVSGEGGAKLRIATLVEAVGVTKGSFYWHFKNRDDFVDKLIDYWHERYTLTVSSSLDRSNENAAEKLRKLMKMVFVEQLTRHDLAIRSWAIAEPKLRALVKRTDDHRLEYLCKLFTAIGFDREASELRARVFLGEAAWKAARMQRMSRSERERNAEAFFELLVAGARAD
jgi:AcrR family transcriptional regulator